jgi:Xaa-Pro aminopeptidase
MTLDELKLFKKVQNAARYTLDAITQYIKPGMCESDLVKKCDELQRGMGINGYWYKSLPALVLAGTRTMMAISNSEYIPSDTPIQNKDLLTIDLNPSIDGYSGDYARTYYIEEGKVSRSPKYDEEFLAGAHAQSYVHSKLIKVAHPEMSFHELHQIISDEISFLGFEVLDYLGHSVQKNMQKLDFIASGVTLTLREAGLFTLEPQICLKGGQHGFKHENIYYFIKNKLHEL